MQIDPNVSRKIRSTLIGRMSAIQKAAEVEGREPTRAEATEFESLKQQVAAIDTADDADRLDIGRRIAAANRGDWATAGNVVVGGRGGAADRPEATGGFANAGEFLQALHRKARGEGLDERLAALKASGPMALSIGTGSGGGYAVPMQFVEQAFEPDTTSGSEVLLNLADRVQMTSDKMTAPAFVDNNHSTSAPFGISWKQVAEGGAIGDEDVTLRAVELNAHKSAAIFYASNEWLSDASPAMAGRLTEVFNRSLRWYCEKLMWRGTGAGEAMGALTGAGKLTIPKESGQAADTLITENILKMFARSLPGSESRLVWAANKTTLPMLAKLTVDSGTAGAPVGLLRMDATAPMGMTLLGRPLYWSEHLPVLGDAGDICLLDPMAYILGDRQAVTIDASPHYRFNYDQTTFRAIVRFDGQPALDTAFTPANGDSCGWLVCVAAR